MSAVFTITACTPNAHTKEQLIEDSNSLNSEYISESYHNKETADGTTPINHEIERMQLNNGLDVLFTHDHRVTDTTISITINAGSFADPEDAQGLAHYLEHIIVNGAIEDDSPISLRSFIQDNFGHIQARTTYLQTTFNLTFDSELIPNVLPVLAQQFSQPNLKRLLSQRDEVAFNDEWHLAKNKLPFILYRINAMTTNHAHPYSQFHLGNSQSLGQLNQQELIQYLTHFHQQYYVAANMQIGIVSNIALSELQESVAENFTIITSGKRLNSHTHLPIFQSQHKKVNIHVDTSSNEKLLMLQFPIQILEESIEFLSPEYLEFLFSVQHNNALTTQLITQGLIRYMSPAIEPNLYGQEGAATFTFGLTEQGIDHKQHILSAFFNYIDIIKKQGLSDSLARRFARHIDNQNSSYSVNTPWHRAHHLSTTPYNSIVNAGLYKAFKGLNQESLQSLLAQFTTDNLRVWHINDNRPTTREVDFANASFTVRPLTEADLGLIASQQSTLNLPLLEVHEATAKDYASNSTISIRHIDSLAHDVYDAPTCPETVYKSHGLIAWHSKNTNSAQPQTFIGLRLRSHQASKRKNAPLLLKLVSIIWSKSLLPLRNTAQLRDNLSTLSSTNNQNELFITLSGASDQHVRYVEQIVDLFKTLSFTENDFAQSVEELKYSFANITNSSTLAQTQHYLHAIALQDASAMNITDALVMLDEIDYQALHNYMTTFVESIAVEVFAFGSMSAEDTKQLAVSIEQHLQLDQQAQASAKTTKIVLPNYCSLTKRHHQKQSSRSISFVIEQPSIDTIANHLVIKSLLQHSKLHSTSEIIPTQCQVLCVHQMLNGHSGLTITALSTEQSTKQLKQAQNNWLALAFEHIDRLSQFEIERAKEAIYKRLTNPRRSFYRDAMPLLADWLNDNTGFNTKAQVTRQLHSVSQRSVQHQLARLLTGKETKILQVTLKGDYT
ncbi:insulinase family protein [Thalassotalea fusca]